MGSNFKSKNTFLFLLAILGSILILPPKTYSQSKSNISVAPQLVQLDLSQDAPEAIYTYTNNTAQTIELKLSMQDVKELEDRGMPGIIDPNESRNYDFGLSNWARFSTNNLIIEPGESQEVTVFIDKSRLTIGGHYGTVLAEIVQSEQGKQVKLRAILSTLLFVRSGTGDELERANIVQVSNDSNLFTLPTQVIFRFQNTGNVELTPYGVITITDQLGSQVGKGIINEDSLITLPDSTRRYVVDIKKSGNILIPGIYNINVKARFGKQKTVITDNSNFFILGDVKLATSIAFAIAFIIFGAFQVKKKRSK